MDSNESTRRPKMIVGTEVIPVIRVQVRVGRGTEDDPNRIETQYWSMDGKYLATEPPEIMKEEGDPVGHIIETVKTFWD